jgi:ABC-type Fe3+ transport system substrate-binding protein
MAILGLASLPDPVSAQTIADVATLKGADRQARLEKGAAAEGQVMLYTTLIVEQAVTPLKAAFEKKYPNIKLNFYRANNAPLSQRVVSEARANKPVADVAVGSLSAALNAAGMLQPFESPETAAFPKEFKDRENRFFTYRVAHYGLGYNTKTVPEATAPKVWEDVLDPKYKGKMIWGNSLETGASFLIQHLRKIWGPQKAGAFFDKLATQNVARSDAAIRTLLDLVIAGEHSILLTTSLNHAVISKGMGAPVWFAMPDPVAARPDHIMVVNNAPHPHAAMLLVDFVLSKEGQTVLAKVDYEPGRLDVEPSAAIRPIVPRLNGKTDIIYPPDEMMDSQDELNRIFDKISP